MDKKDNIEKIFEQNKIGVGNIIFAILFLFGLLLILGSFKNWDWLYKADGHYQNNWSMGQISRYLGRGTARVIGCCAGILISAITGFILFKVLTK
jgi:hypothetical protein